jgi:ribosomal protein L37AE/L43A
MEKKKKTDLRRKHPCPTCKQQGRPLKRAWGMPTEEGLKWEAQGRGTNMGCCLPMEGTWVSVHECRHCGAEWQLGRWFPDF